MRKLINYLLFAVLFFITANLLAQTNKSTKYWIIFKDKGNFKPGVIEKNSEAYNYALNELTGKAVARRMKVLDENSLVFFEDLPVEESYVNEIKSKSISIIAKSKWINGVSAYLTEIQVKEVLNLNFVKGLKLVKKFITNRNLTTSPVLNEYSSPESDLLFGSEYKLNYGNSLKQNVIVNVPKVHDMGYSGEGVLIASFDDGFEWRTHEALKDLNVLDEFDFVNKDNLTSKQDNQTYPDDQSQGNHGTATLSAMCGFKEGKLIGPAYKSDIILAKTEYVSSETPMEEDFWLEASEWAEAKGVDVITSSLGYKTWDENYSDNNYQYSDYDGRTTIVAIASSRLAFLGVIVCNSIGNYSQSKTPSIANGDADSILAVGAVDYKGSIASFSSNGPSSDGRIKPDVVGPGVSVFSALDPFIAKNDSSYWGASGTSLSCPVVAGVCALILSVYPELTPMQVIEAIRKTASVSASPNNVYGYGIVNTLEALLTFGLLWEKEPQSVTENENTIVKILFASNKEISKIGGVCKVKINGKVVEKNLEITKKYGEKDFVYEGTASFGSGFNINNTEYEFLVKDTEGNNYGTGTYSW